MTTSQIESRLLEAYPNSMVAVIDTRGTEDHFEIRISAEGLKNLSRIKQHQAILKLFDAEFKTGELHALEIKIVNL